MGCADFWEMILLLRKVGVMVSFLFFGDLVEHAWFLGSTVMVTSLLLHAAAKPYEDALIDWCEFLSLVSTLFIFMSGVVFKVLNDPSNPATGEEARSLADALEWISILLMFGNVVLAMLIEFQIIKLVTDDSAKRWDTTTPHASPAISVVPAPSIVTFCIRRMSSPSAFRSRSTEVMSGMHTCTTAACFTLGTADDGAP